MPTIGGHLTYMYIIRINAISDSLKARSFLQHFSLLSLSSWCFVVVMWLFLVVLRVCLQFVIVVFPDNTHSLFFISNANFMLS